jgi:uncharacterized coiled-coil protein SlyX
MTDDFLQSRIRLLEQRLYDAERMIEDLNHANDRQAREIENLRPQAMKFDDYERPEVVLQLLKNKLRWQRERWQVLIDGIARFLSETRP